MGAEANVYENVRTKREHVRPENGDERQETGGGRVGWGGGRTAGLNIVAHLALEAHLHHGTGLCVGGQTLIACVSLCVLETRSRPSHPHSLLPDRRLRPGLDTYRDTGSRGDERRGGRQQARKHDALHIYVKVICVDMLVVCVQVSK